MLKHYYAKEAQHIITLVVLKENLISLLTNKIMLFKSTVSHNSEAYRYF